MDPIKVTEEERMEMVELSAREASIKSMFEEAMSEYIHQLSHISVLQHKWWDKILDSKGIGCGKGYYFNSRKGEISEKTSEDEAE